MPRGVLNRRSVLLGLGGSLVVPKLGRAQSGPQPRVTIISQWASGTTGRAMDKIGELFTKAGGKWEHSPVPGFTYDMMNKLRADIVAGDPPAASQLKGPEIAVWSKIAPTVDLDGVVAETGFDKVTPPTLAKLHKPEGKWIALPLQVYRINTLWVSRKAADKIGMTKLPSTWAEYNATAEKMAAVGIRPVCTGGLNWIDTLNFEVVLAGMHPAAYRKAIMELDDATLRGPEVLAAFHQARKMSGWINPASAGQHWSAFTPNFMRGEEGMLFMGNWAQGSFTDAGFKLGSDYIAGPAPADDGKPVFDLNADAFIFWARKEPDIQAGQNLLARIVTGKECQIAFTQINGSTPVRTDIELGAGYSDLQREVAAHLKSAVSDDRVVLSLANNMAQPNQITGAMVEVLTEFMHNVALTPEKAQQMLADAVEGARQ
jgi:glucose/mannose transport system substrate-binding protein